jgi:outer membrane protein
MICTALLTAAVPAMQGEEKDTLRIDIDGIFRLIDSGNRTVAMLETECAATEEGVKETKAAMLPDLDASLSVSYNGDAFLTERDFTGFTRAETPHFGNGFTLDASQVLYAGGVLRAGVKMSEYQTDRSEVNLERTRQGLRLLAAGQYLDLYRTENNIRLYRENIALTEKLIEEIKLKREQGLALPDDVTRYELHLETLRLELIRLTNTSDVLNYRLCNALGLPEGTVICPSVPQREASDNAGLAAWQESAADHSPSMLEADINCSTAELQEKITKGGMLPSIALVAHESFNGPITFEIPPIDKNINIWYVGLGIKYDFSSLYKSRSSLRRSRLESLQARQAEDVAEENLRNEVKQAYTDYVQAFDELATRQKSLQLAVENYQRIYYRYMEQLALVTDMIDAFNMKLDAETGVSDAEAEILYRLFRLKYAAGTI